MGSRGPGLGGWGVGARARGIRSRGPGLGGWGVGGQG